MGFVPRGSGATVTLAVVAYGVTERLATCLASLVSHESATDFDVVCVINPTGTGHEDPSSLPEGVQAVLPDLNLGWAGGLHAARHETDAEWIAWIQDDSAVLAGWLNALLEAAATRPDGAAFGVVGVNAEGQPNSHSGGVAGPSPNPALWNDSDQTPLGVWPSGVLERGWVTSKGLLVRLSAWDEVGGPCARQYPLNHVDKEFGTHLRAHGWRLYVVPGATVTHLQSQSAPGLLRMFLGWWQTDVFAERWQDAVARLTEAGGGRVEHNCHSHDSMDDVERECAIEATRMLVPFSRFASERMAADAVRVRTEAAADAERLRTEAAADAERLRTEAAADAERLRAEVAHWQTRAGRVESSRSWRVTRPLRSLLGAARNLARR